MIISTKMMEFKTLLNEMFDKAQQKYFREKTRFNENEKQELDFIYKAAKSFEDRVYYNKYNHILLHVNNKSKDNSADIVNLINEYTNKTKHIYSNIDKVNISNCFKWFSEVLFEIELKLQNI